MKISRIIMSAGVLSVIALGAHAQNTIPAISSLNNQAPGDLILGFTSTSVTNELVFDVGPADDYYSTTNALGGTLTPGATYTVAAFNSSNLTTALGANAYSSSTLWGAIAGNNLQGSGPGSENGGTLWLTDSGAPLAASTFSAQNTPSNNAEGVGDNINGTSGYNGNADADSQAKNTAASFTTFVNAPGIFNTARLTTNTNALGSGGTSVLELYELQPTDSNAGGPATVNLGYFTLSTTGLTFTAIPEPSTYAAILGALTVGFVFVRRRMQGAGLKALV